jgi:hypothetical protein
VKPAAASLQRDPDGAPMRILGIDEDISFIVDTRGQEAELLAGVSASDALIGARDLR